MNKPRFVISSPFDTYSGYGARSRDIIKSLIKSDKYQIELLSQRWGDTSWGFCNEHPEWTFLLNYLAKREWQQTPVDYWMQITIPNEFAPIGKFNIGVTAGIESDQTKPEWIEGLNRMDLNWVSSNHAKNVFEKSIFEKKDKRTNQSIGQVKLEKPIEVIFEGVDLNTYKVIDKSLPKNIDLSDIKESFCYLFVGHWMQGSFGHDRKNVGVLVKEFYETFKDIKGSKPALILKASKGTSSYISREDILHNIAKIKRSINSKNLPNVYLLNGDFTDNEMNELYNHSKVKAMVSTTKGEGFGRPLLEFSTTGKPIIASGWSGHLDFLNPSFTSLLKGHLENVHPSAANNWLIPESKWFQVDPKDLKSSLKTIYKKYKEYSIKGKQQKHYVKTNFSWDKMSTLIYSILDDKNKVPEIAQQVELKMPTISLPKLKKI
ncbi:MAG: glycosyltransferase [bacterium]|nr:glycosyltransferase [bacterium]